MPKLNDVISTLVSQCADARVTSDLEAIRVAQLYREHEMLKYFSIPRMRLKDVTIDLKAAVSGNDKVEQKLRAIPVNETINFMYKTLKQDYDTDITDKRKYRESIIPHLKENNTLIKEEVGKINADKTTFKNSLQYLQRNYNKVARQLVVITQEFIERHHNLEMLIRKIPEHLVNKSVFQDINSTDMEVDINANTLKELPDPSLINIKLTVFEEGYEIKIDENQTILVPE